MGWKSIFCLLACMLCLTTLVSAVTIYGNVYDLELNNINNAIVEISTSPKQVLVSKNGTYEFIVPQGTYTLKAKANGLSITEQVTVKNEGSFVLDLILFEDISLEEELLSESDLDFSAEYFEEQTPLWKYLIGFALILLVGFLIGQSLLKKPETKEPAKKLEVLGELEKVVAFIKKEGGRTTQKDIRKQFPESEAKISLMISELEAKGIIKKIKKGRGNIIILQ